MGRMRDASKPLERRRTFWHVASIVADREASDAQIFFANGFTCCRILFACRSSTGSRTGVVHPSAGALSARRALVLARYAQLGTRHRIGMLAMELAAAELVRLLSGLCPPDCLPASLWRAAGHRPPVLTGAAERAVTEHVAAPRARPGAPCVVQAIPERQDVC